MRKIRLWIFLGAMWVAKRACVSGYAFDYLNVAKDSEMSEEDYWYDDTYF